MPMSLLARVDELEQCPRWYNRVLSKVEILRDGAGKEDVKPACTKCQPRDEVGAINEGIVDCYLYLGNPANFKPELLASETHERYPEGLVCMSQLDEEAVKGLFERCFTVPYQ